MSFEPDLPALPRDEHGPVFAAPWQAQAFAMAVKLHEAGLFTWGEWAAALGAEIAQAAPEGGADPNEAYYRAWLAALERLVVQKGGASRTELVARQEAWDRAARATPHGEPIVLGREICGTPGAPAATD